MDFSSFSFGNGSLKHLYWSSKATSTIFPASLIRQVYRNQNLQFKVMLLSRCFIYIVLIISLKCQSHWKIGRILQFTEMLYTVSHWWKVINILIPWIWQNRMILKSGTIIFLFLHQTALLSPPAERTERWNCGTSCPASALSPSPSTPPPSPASFTCPTVKSSSRRRSTEQFAPSTQPDTEISELLLRRDRLSSDASARMPAENLWLPVVSTFTKSFFGKSNCIVNL